MKALAQKIISDSAIKRRNYWIEKIRNLSGRFTDDYSRVEQELAAELKRDGPTAILDHLRLCGAIPESYGHDTSEEKLYSKYTDAVLAMAFSIIGLQSIVLTERADAADVEAVVEDYSFVADAKAFRLSRTAKNQKDFKVQAMDGWKKGKPFAMVVCPLYQLPSKSSQIYAQAIARNVCVFSYSHLAILIEIALHVGKKEATHLLHEVFKTVSLINPSKEAVPYWLAINGLMVNSHSSVGDLWKREKIATLESIMISKEISLAYLSSERERIMLLSKDEAIRQLLDIHKIESRIKVIEKVSDNSLMAIE